MVAEQGPRQSGTGRRGAVAGQLLAPRESTVDGHLRRLAMARMVQ